MKRSFQPFIPLKRSQLLIGAILSLGLSACNSSSPTPAATQAKSKPVTATKVDTNSPSEGSLIPKSIFTVNPKDGRDPFFPARRTVASTGSPNEAKTEQPKSDMASSLNLQGIVSGSAFLNDTVISPGRTSEITVVADGKSQKVKIRCLKITKNSVELQMEGHPGTIVLRVGKF